MIMSKFILRVFFFFLLLIAFPAYSHALAPVMLANVYEPGIDLSAYWVSEKMDGVRGYWDGEKLFTREGNPVYPPDWFTKDWPRIPMDGELWAGREQFNRAVSTVRQQIPNDAAWRHMHFMVFDLPAEPGVFDERLQKLKNLGGKLMSPWMKIVTQFKVASHQDLKRLLKETAAEGSEGLMLHRGQSFYRAERTNDLLKLKMHDDAEAKVIAHIPGKGKYTGMLGALLVETAEGRRFKLGTGFSDEQRRHPPVLGSQVTYRYRGFNPSGIPRFASFMRVRKAGY
jgi:DNA ligase-1